ncbi:hypothetical protein [Candidatus Nitrosocosmicus franklandus]|uniref:Uncharacterized protein n=1 Tax=Candidatus Nitrosocosmicus franklandianus TaxID=1798806 RepID=A0A484I9B8_9ARCH|nr:hypothetical protein [Candidatus Nitrosocosmicus franklandus]VFJ13821.1 conserved protein of unknown function [Candidatus Nitrosocosmicus franklandus]
MSDAVLDWESIIHKNVRTKDYDDAGNVDAVGADYVIIASHGDRDEYRLPKNQIDGFNGAEVFLKIGLGELQRYKI